MSARALSTIATTSARSAGGTANLSSVCATSSMNASHSPDVMRRCRCELSKSLPVYFCGPPAAQHSIPVTRYLKPAGGTLVRIVDQGIGVEPLIGHYAVDEVVYDGRDTVDTAEPLVKVGRILRGHWHPLLPHSAKVDSRRGPEEYHIFQG